MTDAAEQARQDAALVKKAFGRPMKTSRGQDPVLDAGYDALDRLLQRAEAADTEANDAMEALLVAQQEAEDHRLRHADAVEQIKRLMDRAELAEAANTRLRETLQRTYLAWLRGLGFPFTRG